jgi:hypothetical protein
MKQLIPALLSALLLAPAAAWADDAPSDVKGCGLVSGALISQGQGEVMINCVGVNEEFGAQLAGILTYVLQNRLDPEVVVAKLNEIEGVPEGDAPRSLTVDQGQTIVESLLKGQPATIAIVANPAGTDSAANPPGGAAGAWGYPRPCARRQKRQSPAGKGRNAQKSDGRREDFSADHFRSENGRWRCIAMGRQAPLV